MIRAAGILFIANDNTALFLKRSGEGDHANEWGFPGGKIEEGETPEQAAVRECMEEAGWCPDGERQVLTRSIRRDPTAFVRGTDTGAPNGAQAAPSIVPLQAEEEVDFTTFVQKIGTPFIPTLNDEHVGYAWAPLSSPPEPLHPGCRIAISRLDMDELGIARAIAAGAIVSPQHYGNVHLFALRITGTGVAYRKKHNEFVYRRPEDYLTPEFLARCNGLPVVWLHPPKGVLDSKEFEGRIVGTVLLPYISGDEVWGIAKIYDDSATEEMKAKVLSTSPGVVLRGAGSDHKVILEDGAKLLIEGKPGLLDHLAICERGVWDKGDAPSGVKADTLGDRDMTAAELEAKAKADAEEKEREEKEKTDATARGDADAGQKLDKMLSHLDSISTMCDGMSKRMDTMEEKEKARSDAEEKERKEKMDAQTKADAEKLAAGEPEAVAADKARKDAAEKEEKEKMDKAKADAEAELHKAIKTDIPDRIAAVERMIPKQLSDADYASMADAQARADTVFVEFGERAPRPLDGEDLLAYRRRLTSKLKDHSPRWKDIDLNVVAADAHAFTQIETQIYADAQTAARNPIDIPEGQLRAVPRVDPVTGLRMTTFQGQKTFIAGLRRPPRYVTGFGPRKDR